jgi:hypothetical protein
LKKIGNEIKIEMMVRELAYRETTKVAADGKVGKKHGHVMKCIGGDGGTTMTIVMPEGFNGFKEKDVIEISVKTSQTSLEDFQGWKEKEKKDVAK